MTGRIFHSHFILLQTPRSNCKDLHAWTPTHNSLNPILLQTTRSDCKDSHAWTPAHISLTFYSTANTQIRLCGCICFDASSIFTSVLFYCKHPDQTAWIHLLGHRLIFHLCFILLQTARSDCVDVHAWTPAHISLHFTLLQTPRSDSKESHAWTPAHISLSFYSTANTQIRL